MTTRQKNAIAKKAVTEIHETIEFPWTVYPELAEQITSIVLKYVA